MAVETVYLALGSNVGDSKQHIQAAVGLLASVLNDIKHAPLYHSKAVGYTDQPDFINTAISGQTSLSPQELLIKIKEIEHKIGRTATFRWGPREIDIDIIFYGDQTLQTGALSIPHPEFARRIFVLKPLLDLSPKLLDPLSGQTVQQLWDALPPEQKTGLVPVDETP